MKCRVCGQEIRKGDRFKGVDFVSIPFCSESCYNEYHIDHKPVSRERKTKEATERLKLTDFLCELYLDNGVETPFGWFGKQIEKFEKDHDCTDRDIKLTIRYAIEYEGYELCTDYGIRQFERFYPLYKQFNEAVKRSKEVAETMQDDPVVPVTPNSGERYIGFKVDLDNI